MKAEEVKELERKIYAVAVDRDRLRADVCNLKARIKYYERRYGKSSKKVCELKRELKVVVKAYEEHKKMYWSLCEKWRNLVKHAGS